MAAKCMHGTHSERASELYLMRMGHAVCDRDEPEICLFLPRGFAHVFARTTLQAHCTPHKKQWVIRRRWSHAAITFALQNERNCGAPLIFCGGVGRSGRVLRLG